MCPISVALPSKGEKKSHKTDNSVSYAPVLTHMPALSLSLSSPPLLPSSLLLPPTPLASSPQWWRQPLSPEDKGLWGSKKGLGLCPSCEASFWLPRMQYHWPGGVVVLLCTKVHSPGCYVWTLGGMWWPFIAPLLSSR